MHVQKFNFSNVVILFPIFRPNKYVIDELDDAKQMRQWLVIFLSIGAVGNGIFNCGLSRNTLISIFDSVCICVDRYVTVPWLVSRYSIRSFLATIVFVIW